MQLKWVCFKKSARNNTFFKPCSENLCICLCLHSSQWENHPCLWWKHSSVKASNFLWVCSYSILEKEPLKTILYFFFWIWCLTKATDQCFLFCSEDREAISTSMGKQVDERRAESSFLLSVVFVLLEQQRVNLILPQEFCNTSSDF